MRPFVCLFLACTACSGPADISYSMMGPLAAPAGKGSFRFGVATAATQIEDMNTNTDWYVFTEPKAQGGLGNGTDFVGDAVHGYTMALDDIQLLKDLHVDSYRFSIEWARVEPQRGVFDQAAIAHYDAIVNALRAANIRPLITLHHFSNPIWVDDPRDPKCMNGPTSTNLCGLDHPQGGPLVIAEMETFARTMAQHFGDRVDEWGTVNEPINYLLASYGVGQFPPGKALLISNFDQFIGVVRNYISAHARMYNAIKAADTVDADGDGVAASVGMSLSVAEWVPSQGHALSTDPADVMARDNIVYVFHHLWPDSVLNGTFDSGLTGTPNEMHPEWKGTLDWLGLQYYARMGVSGSPGLFPVVNATPCFAPLDDGACVPPTDPTLCVPAMGYEYYAQGLFNVLSDASKRWPSLPLVVTESGIATKVGERRAANVVRALEQIDRARTAGADVRGYYHWSLYDNFEWANGFAPKFGLYSVDESGSYARTATLGTTVMGQITGARKLTSSLRAQWGGTGAMVPEGAPAAPGAVCTKQ
jgi:beta-glucosidase